MIAPGARTSSASSQPTGVLPWRRVISWNSTIDCAAWIWNGTPRSCAAAKLSRIISAVQVSICAGATMPDSRPDGWFCAASTSFSASSMAVRPAASSHSYSTTCPFFVNQRAERYIGAATALMPERTRRSNQSS